MLNQSYIRYFRDAPLKKRIDHFPNSFEAEETRIGPAMISKNAFTHINRPKKRKVKRRRKGRAYFGKDLLKMIPETHLKSEKRGKKKPPRPEGLPPHMAAATKYTR